MAVYLGCKYWLNTILMPSTWVASPQTSFGVHLSCIRFLNAWQTSPKGHLLGGQYLGQFNKTFTGVILQVWILFSYLETIATLLNYTCKGLLNWLLETGLPFYKVTLSSIEAGGEGKRKVQRGVWWKFLLVYPRGASVEKRSMVTQAMQRSSHLQGKGNTFISY